MAAALPPLMDFSSHRTEIHSRLNVLAAFLHARLSQGLLSGKSVVNGECLRSPELHSGFVGGGRSEGHRGTPKSWGLVSDAMTIMGAEHRRAGMAGVRTLGKRKTPHTLERKARRPSDPGAAQHLIKMLLL